jgi:hypothetical protein
MLPQPLDSIRYLGFIVFLLPLLPLPLLWLGAAPIGLSPFVEPAVLHACLTFSITKPSRSTRSSNWVLGCK